MAERYREQGNIGIPIVWRYDSFPVSCANRTWQYTDYTIPNVYTGHLKSMRDTVTPDFYRRRKRGEFIFNPMNSNLKTHQIIGGGSLTFTSVADTCTSPAIKAIRIWNRCPFVAMYHDYGGIPVQVGCAEPQTITSLIDEVWTQCMANRGKGSANYAETLAELDRTYGMVSKPLENVIRFVKSFRASAKRHSGFARVNAHSREVIAFLSSEWLRFRYGISPLINDVKAAMKALEKAYEKEPSIHKSRASGAWSGQSSSSGTLIGHPYVQVGWVRTSTDSLNCKAVAYERYQFTPFDELGLTFKNVVGLAWELTRYSFVVDWFANVGDLIYANQPRVGVDWLGGCVVMRRTLTTKYAGNGYTNIAPTVYSVSGSVGDAYEMKDVWVDRYPRGDAGSLVVRSDFRLDQWVRACDASALVGQWLASIRFR